MIYDYGNGSYCSIIIEFILTTDSGNESIEHLRVDIIVATANTRTTICRIITFNVPMTPTVDGISICNGQFTIFIVRTVQKALQSFLLDGWPSQMSQCRNVRG